MAGLKSNIHSQMRRFVLMLTTVFCVALMGIGPATNRPKDKGKQNPKPGEEEIGPDPMMLYEDVIPPGVLYVREMDRKRWVDPGHAEIPQVQDFENPEVYHSVGNTALWGSLSACEMQVQSANGAAIIGANEVVEDLYWEIYEEGVGPPDPGSWQSGTDIWNRELVNGVFIDSLAEVDVNDHNFTSVLVEVIQTWFVDDASLFGQNWYQCQTDGLALYWDEQDHSYNIFNE